MVSFEWIKLKCWQLENEDDTFKACGMDSKIMWYKPYTENLLYNSVTYIIKKFVESNRYTKDLFTKFMCHSLILIFDDKLANQRHIYDICLTSKNQCVFIQYVIDKSIDHD